MSDRFYKELDAIDAFVDVTDPANYVPVPDDWTVIITDIKGSTKAIEAGRYKDVNVVGAASIITAINAAGDVEFPYVFGGDGSTICVPESIRESVLSALLGLAELSETAFDLELRVGAVPVKRVTDEGDRVLVAKHAVSSNMKIAMFWGSGVTEAERLIKGTDEFDARGIEATKPDVDGLQCRWKPFQTRNGVVASVLVFARENDPEKNSAIYRDVVEFISELTSESKPVHKDNAWVGVGRALLSSETRLKTGKKSGLRHNLTWGTNALKTMIGRPAIHSGRALGPLAPNYKENALANTDFRKFDETLRMVLDLSRSDLEKLRAYLIDLRERKNVAFGIHETDAALMTCLIFDLDKNHLHFVDGSNGGYAAAAKELKQQLKDDG